MRKLQTVFSGKTGTGTSSEVSRRKLLQHLNKPIQAKLVLSYGATPTITVHVEGQELDGTWTSLVNATYTTGTPKYLRVPAQKRHRRYRLNITANTNVTVTAYLGQGEVEN